MADGFVGGSPVAVDKKSSESPVVFIQARVVAVSPDDYWTSLCFGLVTSSGLEDFAFGIH